MAVESQRGDVPGDLRGEEISALLNAVKQRVRARYPSASVALGDQGDAGDPEPVRVPLANLLPIVHARDAAQAKVAAIGSVNPRAGGPLNRFIQSIKRLIARSLGWFVRDQVTFNRQVLSCVEASLEAMNEINFSIATIGHEFEAVHRLREDIRHFREVSQHWGEWRIGWEKKLAENEMQFLRTVAELQTGFTHRATMMESSYREIAKAQHTEYRVDLDRIASDLQKRLWADLEKVRLQYEHLIHTELRVVRQRMQAAAACLEIPLETRLPPQRELVSLGFDYSRFADRFRGSEEYVRSNQQFYLPYFENVGRVLDIGCGRGEFLELLRDHNIPARGIEMSDESVNYCRSKGLDVHKVDLFDYLANLPEQSEDIIFCSQVVEHLDPARLPEMIRLCGSRLRKGGILALETPNPECLAIFATHFYLDPTHTRPVPHPLLAFYMEECGLGGIEVKKFAPASESFPEIKELPAEFAAKFFGGLDYAILGRKL